MNLTLHIHFRMEIISSDTFHLFLLSLVIIEAFMLAFSVKQANYYSLMLLLGNRYYSFFWLQTSQNSPLGDSMSNQPDHLTYYLRFSRNHNQFHNILRLMIFLQIFLSPQVKRCTIITYKHGIYELPHKLPNDLRLRKLGNISKVFKLHTMIA